MTDSAVTLELTPESRGILERWSGDKTAMVKTVIDDWLDRIAAWMLRETMLAFDEGRQRGGSTWPANKGRYAAWKASFGQTKPGIVNGRLRLSFAQNIDKAAKTARIGSTLPYAPSFYYGQRGTMTFVAQGPLGKKGGPFTVNGTPARPFFPHRGVAESHAAALFNDLLRHHIGKGA